jgi:uncharacterized protein YggU (UPF0235/DUF167 family)
VQDGALRARVAARPVDGAANEALRRLLAAALDIAPSRVTLASGAASRTKQIRLEDVPPEAIRSRWPDLAV